MAVGSPTEAPTAPSRAKWWRYSLVSVANTILGQAILALCFGVLHWSAYRSAFVATTIVTVPSFVLSRKWVWQRAGRWWSFPELLPFVLVTAVGLVVSTQAAKASETLARTATASRLGQTVIVLAGTTASLAVIWALRFAIFDRLVFAGHAAEGQPTDARR